MTQLLDDPRAVLSRHRRVLVAVLLVLLLLGALAFLNRDRAAYDGALDPRNPQAAGAQALARVLEQRGVDVRVVRGQRALLAEPIDAATGVVVTNPSSLGGSTLRTLRRHVEGAGAMVVVGPADVLADLLRLRAGDVPSRAHEAGCGDPLVDGLSLRTRGGRGLVAPGCFGDGTAHALVVRDGVRLLTSPTSIDNAHVLDADDAAVALRLLGQQPRLVWYVADPADLLASDGVSLGALLPRWLVPSLWLLLPALLALVLWRGRRLGPLVTEPLPVVVRAVESTRARGRLYRRTGDRGHATGILVAASRRRLAEVLGLPRNATTQTISSAVAARTGRDPLDVHALLSTTDVPTNARLSELGSRLTALENEVRHP